MRKVMRREGLLTCIPGRRGDDAAAVAPGDVGQSLNVGLHE